MKVRVIETYEDMEVIMKEEALSKRGLLNLETFRSYAFITNYIVTSQSDIYEEAKEGKSKTDRFFLQSYQRDIELASILERMATSKATTSAEKLIAYNFMSNHSLESLMRQYMDPEELKQSEEDIKKCKQTPGASADIVQKLEGQESISLADFYKLYHLRSFVRTQYWTRLGKECRERMKHIDHSIKADDGLIQKKVFQ